MTAEKAASESREFKSRSELHHLRSELASTSTQLESESAVRNAAAVALSRQRGLIAYINQLSEKGDLKDVGPPPEEFGQFLLMEDAGVLKEGKTRII